MRASAIVAQATGVQPTVRPATTTYHATVFGRYGPRGSNNERDQIAGDDKDAKGWPMLQIISGKFFEGVSIYERDEDAILYSNYS
jgi:hypothetical protein